MIIDFVSVRIEFEEPAHSLQQQTPLDIWHNIDARGRNIRHIHDLRKTMIHLQIEYRKNGNNIRVELEGLLCGDFIQYTLP